MVSQKEVARQLGSLKIRFRFFGKPEVSELAQILNANEKIWHCLFGFYQGGSALLVATDNRLLLIDKRPFFLNLEDIRYEMINEVDFAGRLLDATVSLHTSSKSLAFRSFADLRLREMCQFVQDQITKARQIESVMMYGTKAHAEWRPYTTLLPRPRIRKFVLDNS